MTTIARRLTSSGVTGETVRRFLVVLAVLFWLGGFFFYASIVIPTAHDVLGSHTDVGFITRRVTHWLNVVSLPALAILGWNVVALWRARQPLPRRALAGTWILMAVLQVVLFALHPVMDRLLDAGAHRIIQPARFYGLHRGYLIVSATQHLAGVLHVWWVLIGWHRRDVSAVLS